MGFWQVFIIFLVLALGFIFWSWFFIGRPKGGARRVPVVFLGFAFAVPIVVFLLYQQLGAKSDWEIADIASELRRGESSSHSLEDLVHKVQKRLEQTPDNAKLWFMLGSLATQMSDYDEAVTAYKTLNSLHPNTAVVLAELAQALFLRAGNTITAEVRQFTQQALSLDGELTTALGLAGIDAFQSGNYQQAKSLWERAVRQLDPSSPASQVLSQGIAQAKLALEKHGQSPRDASKATERENDQAALALTVKVSLGEEVKGVPENTVVFVYARAWQGPRMPLAIQRFALSELPKTITLDRSMAMAQGMDITSVAQLEVVARISVSGGASPQSGDWMATRGPVILDAKTPVIELKVAKQIP